MLIKYLHIVFIVGFIVFCFSFWDERELADKATKEIEKIFKEIK